MSMAQVLIIPTQAVLDIQMGGRSHRLIGAPQGPPLNTTRARSPLAPQPPTPDGFIRIDLPQFDCTQAYKVYDMGTGWKHKHAKWNSGKSGEDAGNCFSRIAKIVEVGYEPLNPRGDEMPSSGVWKKWDNVDLAKYVRKLVKWQQRLANNDHRRTMNERHEEIRILREGGGKLPHSAVRDLHT